MKPVITTELQNILLEKPKVDTVYFDESGRHYLRIFELPEARVPDGQTPILKKYGQGNFSHMQVIPGATNVDNLREPVSIGDPLTLIVEEMSRKDVLDTVIEAPKSDILSQIMSLPPAELAAMKAFFTSSDTKETPKEAPKAAPKPNPEK